MESDELGYNIDLNQYYLYTQKLQKATSLAAAGLKVLKPSIKGRLSSCDPKAVVPVSNNLDIFIQKLDSQIKSRNQSKNSHQSSSIRPKSANTSSSQRFLVPLYPHLLESNEIPIHSDTLVVKLKKKSIGKTESNLSAIYAKLSKPRHHHNFNNNNNINNVQSSPSLSFSKPFNLRDYKQSKSLSNLKENKNQGNKSDFQQWLHFGNKIKPTSSSFKSTEKSVASKERSKTSLVDMDVIETNVSEDLTIINVSDKLNELMEEDSIQLPDKDENHSNPIHVEVPAIEIVTDNPKEDQDQQQQHSLDPPPQSNEIESTVYMRTVSSKDDIFSAYINSLGDDSKDGSKYDIFNVSPDSHIIAPMQKSNSWNSSYQSDFEEYS